MDCFTFFTFIVIKTESWSPSQLLLLCNFHQPIRSPVKLCWPLIVYQWFSKNVKNLSAKTQSQQIIAVHTCELCHNHGPRVIKEANRLHYKQSSGVRRRWTIGIK
jgi:hypothetical protein